MPNQPPLNDSQQHNSDPQIVVKRFSPSLPSFLLTRLTPTLFSATGGCLLDTALLVSGKEALLGSKKQVALHSPALATCLQLHPGSLDYHCWSSPAAANNWPCFKSLARNLAVGEREGSGKRAGLTRMS